MIEEKTKKESSSDSEEEETYIIDDFYTDSDSTPTWDESWNSNITKSEIPEEEILQWVTA